MLTRRNFVAGAAAAALSPITVDAGLPHKNIVLIMIDDLFDVVYNLNRFGVRIIAPNLLRLISEGVYFSNAYCSTPLCCPSRAAIISGRNPFKTGVHDNTTPWFDKFDLNSTLPGILAARGYRCFMHGKITHGGPTLSGPRSTRIWRDSGICEVVTGGSARPGETADRDVARDAIKTIRTELKNSRDKWLLMVGFGGPHAPHGDAPELLPRYPTTNIVPLTWSGDAPSCAGDVYDNVNFWHQKYETDGYLPEYIQGYLADVTAMDRELGRLLAAIKTTGLDPTIVLASDHGYSLGDHDVVSKFNLWDEAGRAPLIIKYPNCPAGLVIPETVSLLDIAPTILHRVGILPKPAYMDGESLLPYINHSTTLKRTSGTLTSVHDSISFRDNRYRVTRYQPCGDIELYDQQSDAESRTNLALDPAFDPLKTTMLAKLDAALSKWTT